MQSECSNTKVIYLPMCVCITCTNQLTFFHVYYLTIARPAFANKNININFPTFFSLCFHLQTVVYTRVHIYFLCNSY